MVGMLFAGHWSLVIGCWEFEGARLLTCGKHCRNPIKRGGERDRVARPRTVCAVMRRRLRLATRHARGSAHRHGLLEQGITRPSVIKACFISGL